ncbi:hypothetical protein JK358_34215 [Nocardia sp. 2]|uniref:Uncharacterized protein n=1 Tax=Nocardia acididurans TaxID=2802282 RepID=A0ABS1MFQ6_9NOCA|nr:hypothetical protein [Nocardia acididurans]MBL1079473.1 hypothetical protein [Nocardia acididurans]
MGVAAIATLATFLVRSRWEVGSKAEWVAGLGALSAVVVALWQTIRIQKQAAEDAQEAATRLRQELDAATDRMNTQLQQTRELHAAELDSARALARVQRIHLWEQEQKQAITQVVRAMHQFSDTVPELWQMAVDISALPTREERGRAFRPIDKKIGQAAKKFSIEADMAALIIDDPQVLDTLRDLGLALESTVVQTLAVREKVEAGQTPNIPQLMAQQEAMFRAATSALHTASIRLRTGLDA